MSPNSIYIIVCSVFILVIGYDVYNWARGKKFATPEIRLQRFRKKLNNTVLIVSITFLVASILFHVNLFQYRSPMLYSEIDAITLRDFKGFRLPNQTLDGAAEFAFITTSIDWHLDGQALEVSAKFHPARSYVYNDNIPDKELLMHELYHFHIAEHFARKIREQLSTFEQAPDVQEIERIVEMHKEAESDMQKQYDDETYHGYILKKQRTWQKEVDSLLSSRNSFNQTTIRYRNPNE